MTENNKPIAKFSKGQIKVSVWNNKKDDKEYKTYTLEKSYKDKNDEWQSSKITLNNRDLANVIAVVQTSINAEVKTE